jgi:hypothetical protein
MFGSLSEERLSAAIRDVNRDSTKLERRFRILTPVASPEMICKYGAKPIKSPGFSTPTDLNTNGGRCYWMKKLATGFAIFFACVFIAACTDQAKIDAATQKAQSDAQRAEAAATSAQTASQSALAASQKADQEAASAEDSVRRANDAVARLEAAFSTSVTK